MGSELSAAGGRGSEVSEWPRSKFPASAVRQRRNFGHRNRIIGPYEMVCRGGRLCPPGMAHNIFVGQGPRALPVGAVENRFGSSGRPTPTHHLPIELRRGRRPRRPAASQVAGDRKGRPYGSVTRSAGGERNPPVTASPCQPPLGKGAYKDGGYGLPRPVCALASQ